MIAEDATDTFLSFNVSSNILLRKVPSRDPNPWMNLAYGTVAGKLGKSNTRHTYATEIGCVKCCTACFWHIRIKRLTWA